jgi:hypothetical protein
MTNRNNRDQSLRQDDDHPGLIPSANMASIRLLTQGVASIIEHRYQRQSDQQYADEPPRFPHDDEENDNTFSFIGIFPFLRNLLLVWSFAVILMLLSLGEYGLFYSLAMPGLHSKNVLHFDYTGMGIANQIQREISSEASCSAKTSAERISTNSTIDDGGNSLFNDGSCGRELSKNEVLLQSAPIAVVDLFSNHNSWQHYHPDVVPQPKREKQILKTGAPYFIEILLDLPESETNREKVGMFSVVVDLLSSPPSGTGNPDTDDDTLRTTTKLLASSTRTARMPHESLWISVVRKALCIIPHVFGAIPESRRVTVPSYRFFVESEEFPLRYLTVRLVVSPEKAQRGDIVEVIHGMVHIGKELRGLQLLLKEWFFACAMIGTGFFFSLQLIIVLALKVFWDQRQEQERIVLDDDVLEGPGLDDFVDMDGDANAEDNGDGDRIPHGSAEYAEDEQGEWEDLPTTETNRRRTTRNENLEDNDRVAEGESSAATASSPPATQSGDESHHVIPDN